MPRGLKLIAGGLLACAMYASVCALVILLAAPVPAKELLVAGLLAVLCARLSLNLLRLHRSAWRQMILIAVLSLLGLPLLSVALAVDVPGAHPGALRGITGLTQLLLWAGCVLSGLLIGYLTRVRAHFRSAPHDSPAIQPVDWIVGSGVVIALVYLIRAG